MRKSSLLLIALIILFSCAKESQKKNYPKEVEDRIFSSKSGLVEDEVLTMVKLKTPALFSTAVVVDGKIKIDQDQLEALKAEQMEFLDEVKNLSDKIEVLYRYQYTMNGFTLKTPKSLEKQIMELSKVDVTQRTTEIAPPVRKFSRHEFESLLNKNLQGPRNTSVNFIGVGDVQLQYGYDGKGLSVGILDTGIDFTHKMFEGPGTVAAFESVDPTADAPTSLFPSAKIKGGIDLVGDNFTPRSKIPAKRLPKPDKNPIDISGHGSHVAGTVAGLGDGVSSYSGVVPSADLHAIKVFGGGSTGDYIVLAGFEYAADPNNDNDPADALDVLNLSLGGAYGIPGNLYEAAIKNLSKVGISVVASAGNSGDVSYITGAPATSSEALSVGASIDNMDHNWKFDAISFSSAALPEKLVTGYGTASFTISLNDIETLEGEIVYAGVAAEDFNQELKDKIAGKVALIDRGQVSFVDKVKRALDANAIAVVIGNNQPGGFIQMGGSSDSKIEIPAVMISKDQTDILKKNLSAGASITVDLKAPEKEEKPELIDTLTGFSSRGPRSLDSAIKPEIVGPGQQIVSAAAGSGDKVTRMNGTSMSGPHLAGVMTLMKQAYPELSVSQRKAILIGSAKPISDSEGNLYPVSRQGAGRVQVLKAVEAKLFATPATMSLGEVNVKKSITLRRTLTLTNTSSDALTLKSKVVKSNKLDISMPSEVVVAGNSSTDVKLTIKIEGDQLEQVDEVDAIISFYNETKQVVIPALAVAKRLSALTATRLTVYGSAGADRGAAVDLELKNNSMHEGLALIFNKMIEDERRLPNAELIDLRNNFCDLQSAGYRIVHENGKDILEVGVKTYGPQEVWSGCEVSVLIDSDGDSKPDQEIKGTTNSGIPGLTDTVPSLSPRDFQSFLIDYELAASIASRVDQEQRNGNEDIELNIVSAIQGAETFEKYDHSTVSILRADLSLIEKASNGSIQFKVKLDSRDSEVNESDDFAGSKDDWTMLNPIKSEGAYLDFPKSVTLAGGESKTLELTRGLGNPDLLIYYPYNMTTRSILVDDLTQQTVHPSYND
ncbi:MAG: hypothetical protein CME62_01930 [Halobacteriovoraceae bacterium]|nr:hypothetical protein [Halobacteriovoraceae bacterium]|tara:strand:- start:29626 stop:32802 length:3177 start_codon:yes stop_codon:yes gene_type:complete